MLGSLVATNYHFVGELIAGRVLGGVVDHTVARASEQVLVYCSAYCVLAGKYA